MASNESYISSIILGMSRLQHEKLNAEVAEQANEVLSGIDEDLWDLIDYIDNEN